jgi:hypothetical protein
MNSRQRRQFNRRWKYVVDLSPKVTYSDLYDDGGPIAWVHNNYGYHKYQLENGYCSVRFDDKAKAVQFALMWSGT